MLAQIQILNDGKHSEIAPDTELGADSNADSIFSGKHVFKTNEKVEIQKVESQNTQGPSPGIK